MNDPVYHRLASSEEILEGTSQPFELEGHHIALIRDQGTVYAIDGLCPHADATLADGPVENGCITCPWHGFQYRMEDGQSPPPFTEKIATYATRILDGVVYVNPEPNAPGTPQTPSTIGATS